MRYVQNMGESILLSTRQHRCQQKHLDPFDSNRLSACCLDLFNSLLSTSSNTLHSHCETTHNNIITQNSRNIQTIVYIWMCTLVHCRWSYTMKITIQLLLLLSLSLYITIFIIIIIMLIVIIYIMIIIIIKKTNCTQDKDV